MAEDRLIPLTHMIKSKRARNWTLSGAIEELLDNSFLHGHATKITVVISNTQGIVITDNGNGIDDINRVFQLGNSSAYNDLDNIAQYGVGATDALIWMGDIADVETIRFGRKHSMRVDWTEVEESGLFPLRYAGKGERPRKNEIGTTILITSSHRNYPLVSSEKLAKDLSVVFAPALRKGAKIDLWHRLKTKGDDQLIEVVPFVPTDLTERTEIRGSVTMKDGNELRWYGSAGLSASLVERFNCVHLAFGHRIIEMTRDPFMDAGASTLYAEVSLDSKTPWKYQLSDHKDQIVRYRDELMDSIYHQIKPLLDKSQEQATDLALACMTADIELPINKLLKKAGAFYIDPDDEGEQEAQGIQQGEETGIEGGESNGENPVFDSFDQPGIPASAIKRPHGIKIEYVEKAKLEGRAFAWDIQGKLIKLILEKEMFTSILGWPPNLRNKHITHMVLAFISHAMEILFWDDTPKLRKAVNKKLFAQIETWADEDRKNKIAPYLYKELTSQSGD